MATKQYFYGLGRRKSASASARLYDGKGEITINGKTASDFLSGNAELVAKLTDPLALVDKQGVYDITVRSGRCYLSGYCQGTGLDQ